MTDEPIRPDALSDWMGRLPTEITTEPLNKISIPGTHDSFSYTIKRDAEPSSDGDLYNLVRLCKCCLAPIVHSWSVTQARGIEEQLKNGIRYFDLRVARDRREKATKDGTKFAIVHGQYGAPLEEPLKEMAKFLETHPKEVVIVDMNHIHEINTDAEKKELHESIVRVLGQFLYTDRKVPSLKTMWDAKKQVIFITSLRGPPPPSFWSQDRILSLWPNTDDPMDMIKFLRKRSGKKAIRNPDIFLVHQGVLTPTSSYILLHLCSSLRDLSNKAIKPFMCWLNEQNAGDNGINITITDFAVCCNPLYISTAIRLNYKTWDIDQRAWP